MLWYIIKIIDDENKIVYSYGKETEKQTGEVEFNKLSQEFVSLKLADNDTNKGVERLYQHLYGVIVDENAPDKRTIATG